MESPGTARWKIIMIEDDADFRESVLDGLSSCADFALCGAGSVAEFEATGPEGFDLAIIDVNLPDGSGYDIARALRASSNTRIIMLTGRNSAADRIESYRSGADLHFAKPKTVAELSSAIQSLLRRLTAETDARASASARDCCGVPAGGDCACI